MFIFAGCITWTMFQYCLAGKKLGRGRAGGPSAYQAGHEPAMCSYGKESQQAPGLH